MLILRFILLTYLILTVYGCSSDTSGKNDVLARFNGGTITRGEFSDAVTSLPERSRIIIQAQKKEFLDSMITEALLLKEAEKRGFQHLDDVQKLMKQARKRILVAKLLSEEVDPKEPTTTEEHRRYFENHSENFMTPYRLRASHILLRTREAADAVYERLKEGEDFAELAKELSLDPTGPKGGDIGYFQKGQLLAEIEEAAFDLNKDEISDIVQTSYGFHVIKLTDIAEPRLQNFEAVEEDIVDKMIAEKRSQSFEKLLEQVKRNVDIRIDEKTLSSIDADNLSDKDAS